MSIYKRLTAARELLKDCRDDQRKLIEHAWHDPIGGRSLNEIEGAAHDLYEVEAKAAELEVAMLEDELAIEMSLAVPPNRSFG